MAVLTEVVVSDPTEGIYQPSTGALRPFNAPAHAWQNCRVTFHNQFENWRVHDPNADIFCYRLKPKQTPELITDLVTEVENRVGLDKERCLRISRMEKEGQIQITLGDWWINPVRFNLLTCILRDARKGTIKEVINNPKSYYLYPTRAAVERFLEGNVHYHAPDENIQFYGWWDQFFAHKHNPEDRLKAKPSRKKSLKVRYYYNWKVHEIKL